MRKMMVILSLLLIVHAVKLRNFGKWLQQNNVWAPKCRIDVDNYGGYRLVAAETIAKDEIFLHVPLSCCFSSKIGHKWTESLDWPARMALQLLEEKEKGEESFYKPYLDILPSRERFTSLPHYWPEEDVEQACYPELSQEALKSKNWRSAAWNDLQGMLGIMNKQKQYSFTEDEFNWALDCIMTRNIKADIDSVHMNLCVPLFDFMNHSPLVYTKFELVSKTPQEESQMFFENAIVQVKHYDGPPILAGEEIHLNYGRLDTLKSLCDYGFIPENNVDDFVMLSIPRSYYLKTLSAELLQVQSGTIDTNEQRKSTLNLLRSFDIGYAGTFEIYRDGVAVEMLIALRVLLASNYDLALLWSAYEASDQASFNSPVNDRNELQVTNAIIDIINEELARIEEEFDSSFRKELHDLKAARQSVLQDCLKWVGNTSKRLSNIIEIRD